MDGPIQTLIDRGTLTAPICADVRFPVATVALMMFEQDADVALVYDEHDLVGIFTLRDMLTRVVLRRKDPELTGIGEVMMLAPHTVPANASLAVALDFMRAEGLSHLPVLRGRTALAVLTQKDVLEANVERLAPFATGGPRSTGAAAAAR